MSQPIAPLACIVEWGTINEVHDEGIYSEKTVMKSLWKIIDIHGKAAIIPFENLISRMRDVSICIYEKIESNEKEVRSSVLRTHQFYIRFFLSVDDDLEKCLEKVRDVLKAKNFFLEKDSPITHAIEWYAGKTPMPRKSHTNATRAEAYEEVESLNHWTFERCLIQRIGGK